MAKKNAFQRFVDDFGGAKALAYALGLNESTVYRWCEGNRIPRFETVLKIVELSKSTAAVLTVEAVFKYTSVNRVYRGPGR